MGSRMGDECGCRKRGVVRRMKCWGNLLLTKVWCRYLAKILDTPLERFEAAIKNPSGCAALSEYEGLRAGDCR